MPDEIVIPTPERSPVTYTGTVPRTFQIGYQEPPPPPKTKGGHYETPELTAARLAETARRESLKPQAIKPQRDYWAEALKAAAQAERDIIHRTGY